MLRLLSVLLATVASVLLIACGSEDEQPSADAGELLSRAFATPVESGRMSLDAELHVDGTETFADGLELSLEGPFTDDAADLDVTLGGFGPGLGGGLTYTDDNIWLSFGGQAYEVGEEAVGELNRDLEEETGEDRESFTLESLGLDIESWIADPRVEGEEEVGGEPVTRVAAEIDAAAVLADLNGFAESVGDATPLTEEELELFAGLLEDSSVEIDVAEADDTIRRLAVEVEFEVPEDARGEFGGAEGGAASIEVTLTDVGEPQTIEPPEDARPLDDLLRRFGLGTELFLQ